MSSIDWVARYEEERPRYERLTLKLKSLFEELLNHEGIKFIVEGRAKDIESFKGKMNRKDYENPFDEMTDLCGVRIVLQSLKDLDAVIELIEREFSVDQNRSINKGDILEPDRFGYLSQHFIIKMNDSRKDLSEWKDLAGLWAEVQIRTVLQHAWAVISHSLDYKKERDVPKELRRRLNRLSALFELADEELDSIIDDVESLSEEYRLRLSANRPDVELNADSLRAYLKTSAKIKLWVRFAESLNIEIIQSERASLIVEMAQMAGIKSLGQLENSIGEPTGWREAFFREFSYNTWGKKGEKGRTSPSVIIAVLLIGNYPNIFIDEIMEDRLGMREPSRATVPAKKHNPQFRQSGT